MSKPIARRATAETPDICVNCNVPPKAECTVCGDVRYGSNSREYGFVCVACRPHKQSLCTTCGNTRRVHANWPLGPVCPACYVRILDHPEPCDRCGTRPSPTAGKSSAPVSKSPPNPWIPVLGRPTRPPASPLSSPAHAPATGIVGSAPPFTAEVKATECARFP